MYTLPCHLAFALEIALVAYYNHGEVVLVLHAQNLLLECCDLLKALTRVDRVDEKETLASSHVLLAHRRVFLLAGGIKNIEKRNLIVNHALLAV